ncbi:MAG: hypothetical protein AAF862_11370 [Pseudomonadota bacterium]
MLAAWPLISLALVSKRDPVKAFTIIVIGGYLVLPVKTYFNAKGLPPIGKLEIIGLSALLALAFRRPPDFKWLLPHPFLKACLIIYIISPIFTVFTNADTLIEGTRILKGLELYDILSLTLTKVLTLVPVILAANYIKTRDDLTTFLKWLTILGAFYCLVVLFELRMSPQLHAWIYGFFPHSFAQHVRDGGYRSAAFLGHGLVVSFFLFTIVAAAIALWREKIRISPLPPIFIVVGLFCVLFLNKSLAAIGYGAAFLAICFFFKPRMHLLVAALLATATLSYPLLRGLDLVPTDYLVSVAEVAGPNRADSLGFRFYNEDILLEKAQERPIFGWGRYGRNRVYSKLTGLDESVTDGTWIIEFGQFGVVGFLSLFGLLVGPIVLLYRRRDTFGNDPLVTISALFLAFNGVELLLNSSLSPITWAFVGVLAARLGKAENPGYDIAHIPTLEGEVPTS